MLIYIVNKFMGSMGQDLWGTWGQDLWNSKSTFTNLAQNLYNVPSCEAQRFLCAFMFPASYIFLCMQPY